MTRPKVSVLTPSFNKTAYVKDAIQSVLDQTLTSWEYWLIENSTDPKTRRRVDRLVRHHRDRRIILVHEPFTLTQRKTEYPTTVILNKYLPLHSGRYIYYLSDDDLIAPTCFEEMVNFLDAHPEVMVAYHGMEVWKQDGPNSAEYLYELEANQVHPAGSRVDFKIDGGQVMFRRECLEQLEQPFFMTDMTNPNLSHCDGIFLDRLAAKWAFHPINKTLGRHRRTKLSTWTK